MFIKSIETLFGKTGIYFWAIFLIYLGSLCYVVASFFHLKLKNNWTFWKAYSIAIPIVFIEYIFSLNGNHIASQFLDLEPLQILIITICFYFVNLWLLNYFVLMVPYKHIWREIVAFLFILAAFTLTNVIGGQ